MAEHVSVLRTPPECFENMPDWPYQPHYLQHGNLRMAYVDERNAGSGNSGDEEEVFLCIHGQPTWSYLYRRMIPVFLNHSTQPGARPARRVIAPDLFGFGRSDKPTDESQYTFSFHHTALLHLIETLDLCNITLVVQDWGGILGLTLPLAFPWRFKRFIVMNTSLATGLQPPSKGFLEWRAYSNRTPDMNIAALLKRGCPHLSRAEAEAYNAPFPNKDYKSGVRRFPNLLIVDPSMDGAEVSQKSVDMYSTSEQWKGEDVFMACGMRDMVLGSSAMKSLSRMWRNGCRYMEVQEAGHFVQLWGEEIARKAIEVFERKEGVEGVSTVQPRASRL
ncbi:Uu.00g048160.m01.CDS01 [Anthostomella pinea]|uniref:Uu.00g048160.m01.CDS01 n=1 Tax=Anthostomella pinea TaxID=933095 RepID=A0AAI8YET2_9PEZI|nr:Uu.00g048160.m01.CDS01 [Anthostomella pinea]